MRIPPGIFHLTTTNRKHTMGIIRTPIPRGPGHADHDVTLPKTYVINDLDDSVEGRKLFSDLISTRLSGDLDTIPTCECGFTKDYISTAQAAIPCVRCGTPVEQKKHKPIQSTMFFRAPKEISTLVTPEFWFALRSELSIAVRDPFDTVAYLTNKSYKHKNKELLNALDTLNLPRNYEYFINNLDAILDTLQSLQWYKNKLTVIRSYIHAYRDRIFVKHIALPNKFMVILESEAKNTYADKNFALLTDAAYQGLGIDVYPMRLNRKMQVVVSILNTLADFYIHHFDTILAAKEGAFRSHVFSSRSVIGARCVVVSTTTPHRPSYITIPWSVTIQMLKTHITSKLFHQGYILNQIEQFIHKSITTYNQKMDDILTEIIAESYHGHLSFLLQRFPTLSRGSLIYAKADSFTRDPGNYTISYPIPQVGSLNMDYDGDCVHLTLMEDGYLAEMIEPLSFYNNLLSLNKPKSLNGNLRLSVPVFANTTSWNDDSPINQEDPQATQQMLSLFG